MHVFYSGLIKCQQSFCFTAIPYSTSVFLKENLLKFDNLYYSDVTKERVYTAICHKATFSKKGDV